jgi:ESCRT-I complex subunit VPS28
MSNRKWPKALDESLPEIKLYSNGSADEKSRYDELAALYSIIIATDKLERAYARRSITYSEYFKLCNEHLSQFRITERAALGEGEETATTIEGFMKLYNMNCPLAFHRLEKVGLPELNIQTNEGGENDAKISMEITEHFITAMDAVLVSERAMEDLQPLLSALMNALIHLPNAPASFSPKVKVNDWLMRLNKMRAVDTLDDEDATQLRHDLSDAYTEFKRFVSARR